MSPGSGRGRWSAGRGLLGGLVRLTPTLLVAEGLHLLGEGDECFVVLVRAEVTLTADSEGGGVTSPDGPAWR